MICLNLPKSFYRHGLNLCLTDSALPSFAGICLRILYFSYLKHHSYTCFLSADTFYSCGRLHCFLFPIEGQRVKSNMLASFQYAWQQGICGSASHTIFSILCITVCNRCFLWPLLLPVAESLACIGTFLPCHFKVYNSFFCQ